MNSDELELTDIIQRSTQMLHNIQTGAVRPNRVPPPIPPNTALPPITSTNHPVNVGGPRIQRRVITPQFTVPNNINTYGGGFNNYPYRNMTPVMSGMTNMNMNGMTNMNISGMTNMNMGGFNPYSAYGQPSNNQYLNPVVNAASENARPAFESIHSVVQSFNSVSMMLESTLTAMHMSFQALLGVAENFTRLKMFMMKLYSTIVSIKLARWFLAKIFYLLRMVRGGRGLNTEEELWTSLSSADGREIIPSDGRSWPLVVFTGLLVTTPYLIYKLLNSVTPVSDLGVVNTPPNPVIPVSAIGVVKASPSTRIVATAKCNWNSTDPNTIPLEKGKYYLTSNENVASAKTTGMVLIETFDGKKGYVPLAGFKTCKTSSPLASTIQDTPPSVSSNPAPSNSICEKVQPKVSNPVTDVHGNPIALPHPLVDCDKSNIGRQ